MQGLAVRSCLAVASLPLSCFFLLHVLLSHLVSDSEALGVSL